MRKSVGPFLVVILFVAGHVALAADAESPIAKELRAGKKQQIVAYGTSLTAGGAWVSQLQADLNRRYPGLATITNSGGSGQYSEWGVKNLENRVLRHKPDVVLIEFAINDAVERFHCPVEQAKKNLETMLDQIAAARPQCRVFLQVTNPVLDRPAGNPSHRLNLDDYYQMYRDVAAQRKIGLIDHGPAWKKVLDEGPEAFRKFAPDGLHPNAAGCEKIMTPAILTALGVAPQP